MTVRDELEKLFVKAFVACLDVLLQRGKVEEKSERHVCRSPGPYSNQGQWRWKIQTIHLIYTNAKSSVFTGQNDRCGNSTAHSQAPDDGYIIARNMLST